MFSQIYRIWKALSDFGVLLFDSESEKKYRRIQNQLLLVFIAALISLTAVIAALAYTYKPAQPGVLNAYLLVYLLPTVTMLGLLVVALFAMRRFATPYPVIFSLAAGVLFIGLMGIAQQRGSLFYLYNLALLPIPFIAVPQNRRLYQLVAITVTVSIIAVVLSSHWFLEFYAPLLPLPEPWMVSVVAYITLFSILLTLAAYFYYIWRQNTETEQSLENERRKSDALLLNILPAHVAHELKDRGSTRPVLYDSATVLFTDFVGFTQIAERLTPSELIGELDKCFSHFDSVCRKHGLEKLKTIGDAYMCAGGLPLPNRTHAVDCCLAALAMQAFMQEMQKLNESGGHAYWQLRIGLNSGHLVAGVIGAQKFSYDIWGDTVNTASRAESTAAPGRINMTETTYELVKDFFHCERRGSVDVKNKAPIAMYYLVGLLPELSTGGDSLTPNAAFVDRYRRLQA
ncbi:MAG: adenylate/guanylate cyclase domain-containing protein [Turneriella sp.]